MFTRVTVGAVFVAVLRAGLASPAEAEWRPSGAVTAGPLIYEGDIGAAALVDIWEPLGMFRLGGSFGGAALPSDDEQRSRVLMPVGISAAFVARWGRFGLDVRTRVGAWGGATHGGLSGGGWLAVGGHVEYVLDRKVAISAGVDGWFLFDDDSPRYIVPGLGLVWTLPGQ